LQLKANKNNEWTPLQEDGDFRSYECVELLKQSDIVITNPPFSLYRQYIKQLFDYNKKFVIIASKNTITYKEVFPYIKENKLWVGAMSFSNDILFIAPKNTDLSNKPKTAIRIVDGVTYLRSPSMWVTNIDHGRRHQPLGLMTMAENLKFNKKMQGKSGYLRYDNYDATEVPFTNAIPSDYWGVMGVPISFLDKYNPDQFEILGTSDNGIVDDKYKTSPGLTQKFVDDYYKAGGTGAYKEGNPTAGYYEDGIAKMAYKRIFIKHKKK
jgi:hypothetical protein